MKKFFFYILLLISSNCLAQTEYYYGDEAYHFEKNSFYIGGEFGRGSNRSIDNYSPVHKLLKSTNEQEFFRHYSLRAVAGFNIKDLHRIELSLQNIELKNGYALINLYGGGRVNTTAGYFGLSYLITPLKYKFLQLNVGPHLGFVVSTIDDFTKYERWPLDYNITGYYESFEDIIHRVFINFGGRTNLIATLGKEKRSELFFNFSIYYTPYQVRARDYDFYTNEYGDFSFRSSSNIFSLSYSLGYAHKFFIK